ncbi:MAG: hypothetical protein D3920_09935, partial [Candidatus Electrothrix sp. AW2]|nr:hypothetical protein [Candidatus Electrothrix gigas]
MRGGGILTAATDAGNGKGKKMMDSLGATERQDFDSPWKEILECYFQEFITFFFPEIAEETDWERGYLFLDKEFQQVTRDAELGRRYAD